MIYCKALNKEYESRAEMFKALRDNKESIIASKKAQIFKSHEKGIGVTAKTLDPLKLGTQVKGINVDSDYYYIAVNSTRILDSHGDVHTDTTWDRTSKDQQGKNYLVADHNLTIDATVARKENVEMFLATVPFALLGMPYDGDTVVLIYKVKKTNIIHPKAKEWLESGDDIEASVRMQYVKILFCLNSDDQEDSEYKKNYLLYHSMIANKDEFDDIDYFWAVTEAKNLYESSLVLFGSNSATGQIEENKSEPSDDTQKTEPSNDTQIIKQIELFTKNI